VNRHTIRLGFIPLTDCAPLVIAQEKGWFRKHGLAVELVREPSWANIRDKVALGLLDGGHMLAPMPLAATLGLGGLNRAIITALSLDLNGSAITISKALWQQMRLVDPQAGATPLAGATALRGVIERRRAQAAPPLVFAAVFPYSMHNYLLRYWLAAGGIDPDADIRLVFVPPPLMVDNLAARRIDGFSVGEPWNHRAVDLGIGRIAAASSEIWSNHPEKVLGVSADWARRNPETHAALIAAIIEAGRWLDEPANRAEAARIIAAAPFVNAPEEIVALSLTGRLKPGDDEPVQALPSFNIFHRCAANFPWVSHAEWMLLQMVRWGQVEADIDIPAVAARVYRPDLYRKAALAQGLACPAVDRKSEGTHAAPWTLSGGTSSEASVPIAMGPDSFIDGATFDPAAIDAALAQLAPRLEQTPTQRAQVRVP
jgi:ABC-type nitrate/sulfonate/bicarbonate transport system substrate-binding protein